MPCPPPAAMSLYHSVPAMRVLDWNEGNAETFAPAFGSELLWLWKTEDKERFPSCRIKGNVRVALLTWNDQCEEDEYIITFRCGMTRVITQGILQAATQQHNQFVKSTAKLLNKHVNSVISLPQREKFNTFIVSENTSWRRIMLMEVNFHMLTMFLQKM